MIDYELVLNRLGLGLVGTSAQHSITYWNEVMTTLTHLTASEVLGQKLHHILPHLEMLPSAGQVVYLPADQPHQVDLRLEVHAIASEAMAWLWVFQPYQRSLEQIQTQFVATVSHELRTPLTSIKGFVDTLLQTTVSPDQQQRFLGIVKDETERLAQMVEDLLLVAGLQSGSMANTTQAVALSSIVDQVTVRWPQVCRDRVQVLIPPELPLLKADAGHLVQIMYQLLDNGLKYSNGTVVLQAGILDNAQRIQIQIRDQGLGIPAERLPNIFHRFQPRFRAQDGTGLGLYIAKSLTEAMGGSLHLDSQEAHGTTCWLTLPTAQPSQPRLHC